MAPKQIELSTVKPAAFFGRVPPKAPGEGLRFVFSEDLRYNDQAAGMHAGVATTVRTKLPGPGPFQGGELIHEEGTYDLKAVPGLDAGQVTVQGVFPIDQTLNAHAGGAIVRLAITGGTDAYKNARGQVTVKVQGGSHTLDIEV